jgi:stage IV sporulation protein B
MKNLEVPAGFCLWGLLRCLILPRWDLLPWCAFRFLLWVEWPLRQMIRTPAHPANFLKGVIGLYGPLRNAKRLLRGGAALVLAILLCAGPSAGAVSTTRMLVPVGHTVGIKLFSRGVLVVKLPEGGTPARECGLRTGDIIVKCGGVTVNSTEQFQSLLQTSGETDLQVCRAGRNMTLSVAPEQNEQGVYAIGAWIRDSMAGIGTVTYYDPATGAFGALGHGITDVDTAQLMPFASGSILPSTVKAVKMGTAGDAGELRGNFDLTGDFGSLSANTENGIFGTVETCPASWQSSQAVPAASAGEVREGPAVILANVEGDTVREYDIQILKVVSHAADGRDLVLSVTDPDLLAATGGIVQGMSGSPILQDGKLVGAVTHVLLNDPSKGYGILIENMLDAGQQAE